MDKKQVTVMGSCVTRELFNDERLEDIFDVKLYAFKICPWALFEEGLDIPTNLIKEAPIEEFLTRNIDYEFNKNLIEKFKQTPTDYFVFDFFPFIDTFYNVSYNNKTIHAQTNKSQQTFSILQKYLESKNVKFQYEKISIEEIDEELIKKGLQQFANFLISNYKNIAVVWPHFASNYLEIDGTIKEYSEKTKFRFEYWQKYFDKWTSYIIDLIPNIKVVKIPDNLTARRLFEGEFYYPNGVMAEPIGVHLMKKDYQAAVTGLLNDFKINYKDYYTKSLDYAEFYTEQLRTKWEQLSVFIKQSTSKVICNINTYANYLSKLKHHLIIFTAHSDAQYRIKYFKNRSKIGLKCAMNFRDSYIGVVDTKNNFIYENSSHDALSYNYAIPNTTETVVIESKGLAAGGDSSINYAGKEFSKKKRGFNIFVLDLDTMEVVDTAHCDTCMDEYLLVDSDMFAPFND